jgi:hypothetical protein
VQVSTGWAELIKKTEPPESSGRFSTVGPVAAATVIGGICDVSGLPDRDHFAAHNGTASAEGVL